MVKTRKGAITLKGMPTDLAGDELSEGNVAMIKVLPANEFCETSSRALFWRIKSGGASPTLSSTRQFATLKLKSSMSTRWT